jgi:CBS domain-containing protein
MKTAREIMTPKATWVPLDATLTDVARKMAQDDIGAIPVCDTDRHLRGMVTDRDLALKAVAEGRDPRTTRVSEIIDLTEVVTIGADDSIEEAVETMKRHGVRRLPVIDGHDLVGMVSQADIARALPDKKVGDLVGVISEAPPNN